MGITINFHFPGAQESYFFCAPEYFFTLHGQTFDDRRKFSKLIFAADVQYNKNSALAAGILFPDWHSDQVEAQVLKEISGIAPYEPGSFYKRELPCIQALLEGLEIEIDTIVVDGFVCLGAEEKDGLGMHLYHAIEESVPVIGVAKKAFEGTPEKCRIFRGKSKNPLYVTSVGISLEKSKKLISGMHGENRIPTLLKKVDQLCRGIVN